MKNLKIDTGAWFAPSGFNVEENVEEQDSAWVVSAIATIRKVGTSDPDANEGTDGHSKIIRYFGSGAALKRVFFDVSRPGGQTIYDYHGRWFGGFEQAIEVVELIMIDLSCSDTEENAGAEVRVRSEHGDTLFTVSVPA